MRFDAFAKTVDEGSVVTAAYDEARPTVDEPLSSLSGSGRHAPPLAVFRRCFGHTVDGVLHSWVVYLKRVAETDGEIAAADEEEVDALNGGDFIDTFHCLPIFDLYYEEGFPIGVLHVL